MAQTKRKRRSKHRGTAAGNIEARGRTGRKPTPEEIKKAEREARLLRPPSWRSAAARAGISAILLFALFQVGIGPDISITSSALLAVFAMAIYVPLGYFTDRLMYRRRLRKSQAQAVGPGGTRRA